MLPDGYISLRAFGRKHGGMHVRAVQKAIESGRVPESCVLRKADGTLCGIHDERAWEAWQRNTDPVAAAKNGKFHKGTAVGQSTYASVNCTAQASTPGVQSAPRASLSGVGGQVGDDLLHAVTTSASPAAPSDPRSGSEQASVEALRTAAESGAPDELVGTNSDAESAGYNGDVSGAEKRSAAITNSEAGGAGSRSPDAGTGAGSQPASGEAAQLDLTDQVDTGGAKSPPDPGFAEHRAKKEKFLADTAELEYLKAIGAVTDTAAVDREIEDIFRSVRANVMRVIPKQSAVLAAETDPSRVERLLTDAINQAFHESSSTLANDVTGGAGERAAAMP